MTSHVGRLYAAAGALLAFFVLWATIAAHPWASSTATDPRLVALAQRERHLRADAALVQKVVDRRYAAYRAALAKRRSEIAAAKARPRPRSAVAVSQASSPASHRHAPATRDHEDVVMERTAFRAMGTDVELLLDVPAGRRSGDAFAAAREEFARLEAILSRSGRTPSCRS